MRFVRMVIGAFIGAALGAAAGRVVARWRDDSEAGLEPQVDFAAAQPRPRDLVPGLIAALRVQDHPWSYLRIPSWLAAFSVNFAVTALERELGPVLRALGLGGSDETVEEPVEVVSEPTHPTAPRSDIWTAEVPHVPESAQESPGPASHPPGFRPFAR
jgi:hypothetical protein